MDSTDMGFALYDSELHLLDLNRVALGWALMNSPPGTVKENIIGKSISEVFPGIEKTEVYAALEKVIETGESIPMEGVSSVSDEMWMLSSAFRVGSGFGVICRDISRRRKLQEALQRAEVISAVEQMGATVAHDLRGPLGLIVQSVNMIKQDPSLTRRMLQLVEENAVRSLKMIADWRSSTREIVPHPTKTDLGGLIKSVLEGSTIPSSVTIVTSFGADLDSIMIDSDIMHRIMDNLVKNAVEAMPEGGKLSIRAEKEGDDIVINVGDTGVGIPEESKGRIFSPLYTTKAGGMGLGLTYCRRAVEAQGGSIDFESKVGAGTNFTIKLPLDPNISV
jgi:signal transduction histidine kinase